MNVVLVVRCGMVLLLLCECGVGGEVRDGVVVVVAVCMWCWC